MSPTQWNSLSDSKRLTTILKEDQSLAPAMKRSPAIDLLIRRFAKTKYEKLAPAQKKHVGFYRP